MRVNAQTREATRRKILDAALDLFQTTGFEAATTRDIARAAGIAAGTLFNYFPSKEAIAITLVTQSLAQLKPNPPDQCESLEEALFAYVAGGLRRLKPCRAFLAPVIETALSPLAGARRDDAGLSLRADHLEQVVAIARHFRLDVALNPVALQMYWTLYLGVLAFWVADKSPRQEETLALLDQSLQMFAAWLRGGDAAPP